MKNILITSASGVLAKKLIKKIKDNNFNVIASTRDKQSLNYKEYGVKYINNDDIIATDILKDVDLIINCAFPRKQEPEILAGAIQFFDCLIMRAVEMNVKSFINISSQSVYNPYRELPATEIDDIKPADNYGLTKYACEIIGCTTVQNSNTNFTNIRLASLIGKEYPERVINKIMLRASKTGKISINNDKNVFGYFDVDEAVEGIFEFIKNSNPENWDKIYNLGATFENQESFKDIAIYIQELLKERNIDVELEITMSDKADKLCLLDSNEFYKVSKWIPKLTLKESIIKIMEGII